MLCVLFLYVSVLVAALHIVWLCISGTSIHLLSISLPLLRYCLSSSSPGHPAGTITVQAEEIQDSKFILDFQLSATKLEKKDLFGKVGFEVCMQGSH